MHSLSQLEKQQVGLRLPKYLIEEIDQFTQQFALNRTEIITEAISTYIREQKAKMFYDDFDASCKELQALRNDPKANAAQPTLDDLIDELEDH